jgi:hypothetical protein
VASSARSDDEYAEAVLTARLNTKFLSAMMHIGSWAHSSFSFSGNAPNSASSSDCAVGGGPDVDEKPNHANSLLPHIARLRALISSAKWKSCLDLGGVLYQALASRHAPAVLAAVLVADVSLRIAIVDPVSVWTTWQSTALDALREVLRGASADSDADWHWLSCLSVVRLVVEELISSLHLSLITTVHGCGGPKHSLSETAERGASRELFASTSSAAIVSQTNSGAEQGEALDVAQILFELSEVQSFCSLRLITSCIPRLDDLRRRLFETSFSRSCGAQRPRRIRPLAADCVDTGGKVFQTTTFGVRGDTTFGVRGDTWGTKRNTYQNGNETERGEERQAEKVSGVFGDRAVENDLWQEFYRRLDSRVRDVVRMVIASGNWSCDENRRRMLAAGSLLLPDVPYSVVQVASEYCARAAKGIGKTSKSSVSPTTDTIDFAAQDVSSPITRSEKLCNSESKLRDVDCDRRDAAADSAKTCKEADDSVVDSVMLLAWRDSQGVQERMVQLLQHIDMYVSRAVT